MVQAHTFEATLGGAGQWGSTKRTLELAKLGLEDCRSGQARLHHGFLATSTWAHSNQDQNWVLNTGEVMPFGVHRGF